MKTLYLLRHAKAEAGGKNSTDRDRVLAPRGREACAVVGNYMRRKAYLPDVVLASPSARTRETLARVAEAAAIQPRQRFEDALYLASAEEIIRSAHTLEGDAPSALIVGHNPGMHHVALLLGETRHTGLRHALELKYPTCALTALRFDASRWEDIAPGQGEILDFVTPEDL